MAKIKENKLISFLDNNDIKRVWLANKLNISPQQLTKYINTGMFQGKYQREALNGLEELAIDIFEFCESERCKTKKG